jgi:hypothetical protein
MSLFPSPETLAPSPAAKKRTRRSADTRHLAPDTKHSAVREEIWRVYNECNNDLQCPWSFGKHDGILKRVLATAPNWDVRRWHTCILNRFASEDENLAEDPARWMPRLPSYAVQPLNRFGKLDKIPQECWARHRRLCDRYWEIHPESGH